MCAFLFRSWLIILARYLHIHFLHKMFPEFPLGMEKLDSLRETSEENQGFCWKALCHKSHRWAANKAKHIWWTYKRSNMLKIWLNDNLLQTIQLICLGYLPVKVIPEIACVQPWINYSISFFLIHKDFSSANDWWGLN